MHASPLLVEKNRILYSNLPLSIASNALLAIILVLVQRSVIPAEKIATWIAIIIAALLGRTTLVYASRHDGFDALQAAPAWMRRFRAGAIATGIAWGLATPLLFPAGNETHQVFLSFVLAGLNAGAISSLAIDRVSVLGFIIPALLPLIARFVVEGGTIANAMAAMITVFLVFISASAAVNRRALNENFRLRVRAVEQEQKLKESNLEFQQFAYIASHDLQEPLRMVSSYVMLLSRRYKGKLDHDADEFIRFAVDGAMRLQDMINGLLQLSRVQTRGEEMKPVAADSLLKHAVKRLEMPIEQSHAAITADPLPEIVADASQLSQVFQNLISNAIKFRKRGETPRIHVSAEEGPEEWVFSVEDNGIGIDPKFTERLFVMFQRLHSREEFPGTGIGLAVCKRIVERHGGRIWFESVPGKGTTFFFSIRTRKTGHRALAA